MTETQIAGGTARRTCCGRLFGSERTFNFTVERDPVSSVILGESGRNTSAATKNAAVHRLVEDTALVAFYLHCC